MVRKVLAILDIEDERPIAEGKGTLDYLESEIRRCGLSGISLYDGKILDSDDPEDEQAIALTEFIFGGGLYREGT